MGCSIVEKGKCRLVMVTRGSFYKWKNRLIYEHDGIGGKKGKG